VSASPTLPDAPTTPEARLPGVDILRGIALLGIFIVNMLFFSGPYGYFGTTAAQNELERWLEGLVRIFAQGAFYSLFSFLFGLGLALQLRHGRAALPRFRRRLVVLLLLGLFHAVLIWYGDILLTYAAGGFVLTLFAFRRSRVVVAWALVFFALSCLTYLTPFDPGLAGREPWINPQAFNEVFGSGTYFEVVRYQAQLAGRDILNLPSFLPTVLWLFLLGLLAGRGGLFERPNRRVWWGILLAALPAALVFKGFYAYWFVTETYSPFSVGFSFAIGGPALMFVYLALLTLLLQSPLWARRLAPFGLVGRMALTHYLTQSVVCTLLFNGYGLGYFDELRLSVTLLLVPVIFALQVLFSHFWLSRFRFGPAEWVWRSLTYGARQPLRRRG
jgi:uncharacterized protein